MTANASGRPSERMPTRAAGGSVRSAGSMITRQAANGTPCRAAIRAAMWDSMSQLWESTQSDERLVQVNADWAACMGEAGHPGFTLQQDAMQDVSTRWSELNGWPEPGEEMETATELTAEPTRPPAEAVSKFQAEEIALAVADFDCQEKVGYQKLFETVRIEAESQFVQDHRAELERYRDSLAGGGG